MKYLKSFLVLSFFVFAQYVYADFEEGVHYERVSELPSEDKFVSVYFNYGCPGCYKSEPLVDVIRGSVPEGTPVDLVPFENNPGWKIYVQAFFIAEMLGIQNEAHEAIFHQIHVEYKQIPNLEKLKELYVSLGASPKRFDQAAKSFQLDGKMRQARKKAIANRILSTPSFVVNDRYRLNLSAFTSNQQIVDAINHLLKQ